MNKFVILGCGYLGTNIANYIAINDSNSEVFVLGMENEYINYLNENISFISKMIEQISDDDLELFKDAIVIDAVGNINATNDSKNGSTVFLNNCASKVNLIQKLNGLDIRRYVFLSSGGTVYDDSDVPHKEDEKLNPKNIYALEKVFIEDYLKIYGLENEKFSYIIIRLSNPYGGITSKNKKQGIIDVAISKIKNDEILEFYGDMGNVRDYIYIDDVAFYIYNLSIMCEKNDIYNVASGKGTSIEELFDIIEQVYNKKIQIINKHINTINIKTSILNIDKLKAIINSKDTIDIKEGIERYLKK